MKLKISKKMATIILPGTPREEGGEPWPGLPGCDTIRDKMRTIWATPGGLSKDGSCVIDASDAEAHILAEHGKLALAELEIKLNECTADEEKKPFFGANSAWSALMRAIDKERSALPA
ncbi:hypothetical protein PQR05_29400 [Paraburkholderia sediminicola]|uniref:hypothetical protein n=1 Tax=Paraburkholderia sediminicola TaxID=458836 RepID=UPI0038BCD03A